MKKLIFTLLGVASTLNSYGQNISDALRYSTESTQGTARFKSMSGAFGALGGDMSALVLIRLELLFLTQVMVRYLFPTQALQITPNTDQIRKK